MASRPAVGVFKGVAALTLEAYHPGTTRHVGLTMEVSSVVPTVGVWGLDHTGGLMHPTPEWVSTVTELQVEVRNVVPSSERLCDALLL